MTTTRRIALVNEAGGYVGPALAREFARRGHDLVLGNPSAELVGRAGRPGRRGGGRRRRPQPGQARGGPQAGGRRPRPLRPHRRRGRPSPARSSPARFMESSVEDLRKLVEGCLEAPYHFLKAVAAPMVEQGSGQIVLITSAAGARPTPGAPLYSVGPGRGHDDGPQPGRRDRPHRRPGQRPRHQLHGLPRVPRRRGRHTIPRSGPSVESQVPMRRLGTMEEFASFCHGVPRRHQRLHHRPVRRLRRRLGLTPHITDDAHPPRRPHPGGTTT